MAPKLWVLVDWVDESNVISSYGVVKADIQLYNKTGLQPGQITLLRIKQNIRRAKILRISESKSYVEEQRLILEHQDQQMQNVLKVFIQTIKQMKSENLFNVQQRTSSHSPIPEVLDVRNDYSDSSSDSEANVNIYHFKSGNFSKSTSKYTPYQQSTSKQTRSTLKANNLSRRSINSSTPLLITSAQEDINYTPQHKHRQSNRKQTQGTLKENNLSHQSTISSTPLPSTSAQEGIKSSCDKGSQTHNTLVSVTTIHSLDANLRSVHNNFKYLLTKVNITNRDDLTPMSETEQDKEASNIEQNVGEIEPNNKDKKNDETRVEVGAKEIIDNKDNEEVGAEEVIDNKDNEEVVAKEVIDNNDNEKVDAEEVIDNNDNEEVGAKEVIDNNDSEKVDAKEVIENNDNGEVRAEVVIENKDSEEVGAEEVIENNGNEEVGAEEVIENNDNKEVGAEEVIGNNDNEEVGAEEVIENNYNEEVGAEEVIENNDNEEVGAEEVIENNDNEEVGAEEVIENNGGEQQADSLTVKAEQKSKPTPLRVRRMSAHSTNDIKISMVPIGFGNTMVPESVLRDINWSSYTLATRSLLTAVFPQSVLATHSLTGKSNPAFTGKPVKEILDPTHVEDIIHTVVKRCRVTKNYVRGRSIRVVVDGCSSGHMNINAKVGRYFTLEQVLNLQPKCKFDRVWNTALIFGMDVILYLRKQAKTLVHMTQLILVYIKTKRFIDIEVFITCITLKCGQEARALRIRQQAKKARMSQDENDENISPYTSSDE